MADRQEPAQRLWAEWRKGQRPDLDAFIASLGPLTIAQLADLLRVDQRERWRLGERPRAEHYLNRYPVLRDDPDRAFDLVYNEILMLEEAGESPRMESFLVRFPEFDELLREQFALYKALDSGSHWPDGDSAVDTAERIEPSGEATGHPRQPSVPGYEVIRQVGRGGMGVVYEARQLRLMRRVALKMIREGAHASSEERERLRSEAVAAARLHHPNIVEIYEVGELDGCPYIVIEYVDGGNLSQRLGGAPQSPRWAAQLVRTLADAVHHAHLQGVIHRDLKPANVLMSVGGVAKIADFGLAKCRDEDLEPTRSGTILGSPCYIAPEQAAGQIRDVGPAADVYSLGAILYELLTGRPPFRSATVLETLEQVRTEEPTRPSRWQLGVPRDLETICMKCLEKQPSRRYLTALDLAEELGRFLEGEPIRARPLRAPARLGRWCRRKPALAGALGLASLALLATMTISVSFAVYQYIASARLAAALRQVEARGHEVDRLAADLAYEHGQALCEQGDAGQGMLWMARGLVSATRAHADDLQRALRANLAAWLQELHELTARWEASAPVIAVAISPDGSKAVSGNDDGLAQLWDLKTGEESGPALQHGATVTSVAFSPDGKTLLTGCSDSVARFWDVASRRPAGPPLKHAMTVSSVAFSPDGSTALTGCWDGYARLWDIKTGASLGQPMEHQDRVSSVAFSHDGRMIATGSWDHNARLWEAPSGKPVGQPMSHPDYVWSVAFRPDGRRITTACFDRKVWFWDVATRQPVGEPLSHQHCVSVAAYSPDGRTILTGCQDATVKLWDAETSEPIGTSARHKHSVTSAVFSPDGTTVLTAGLDKSIRLWRVASPVSARFSHDGYIRRAVFSPDGSTILSGGVDSTARLWDASTGRILTPPLQHGGSVQAVAFSPDGRTVLTGGDDRTARLWDARTGEPRGHAMQHKEKVWALAFSPDGKSVITGSYDSTTRLWEAATGLPLGPPMRQDASVQAVAFSPDGRTVLTGSDDRTARLWDARDGSSLGSLMRHEDKVWALAFSPNGKAILTASWDNTARLWDAQTGNPIAPPLRHDGPLSVVAFTPDGRTALTGGWDMRVRQWDALSGRPVAFPLRHHGAIRALAVSPDSLTVLTGSYDRTAQLWDRATGKRIGPAIQHRGQVWFVDFSPDGQTILSGGQEPVARIRRVSKPLSGDPVEIQFLIQSRTGMELLEEVPFVLAGDRWLVRKSP